MCQNDSNDDGVMEACGYYPPAPGLAIDPIFGETLCPWGLSPDRLFTFKVSAEYLPGDLAPITACGVGALEYSECVEGQLTSEFYAEGETANVAVQTGNLGANTNAALENRYAVEGADGLYECDVEATPDSTGLDPDGKEAARYAYVEDPIAGCEYRLVVVPVIDPLPLQGASEDVLVLGVATFAIAKWDRAPGYGDAQGTPEDPCGELVGPVVGLFECGMVWGYLMEGAQPPDFLLEQGETTNPFAPVITIPAADLSLEKRVDPPFPYVNVGDTIDYILQLNNSGPTAVGVQVVDQLPAGVTFVSAESSRPEMDYDPETGIWNVDYLDAGWVELRITATVDIGTAGTTITNFAQVTGDNLLNTEDDLASAEIFIPAADLSLSKRVDPPFPYVNVGDTIDYILQLNNSGPTAVGVQVVDQLPAGVTFVSAESSRPEMDYDPETGIWDVDYLDAGWVELRITATVDIGTAGTTITNFAQVTGDNLLNTEDDLASTEIFIPAADLSLSKRVDPPFPYVNVGDTIDYILQLNNSGPTAVGVQVVDQLPAGVTFVSAESSRPEMDYDPETGIWNVDYLDAGWVELRITATVDIGTAGTTITNFAQVTGDNLFNTEDDLASAEIFIPAADLSLSKRVAPPFPYVNVGDTIDYILQLNNSGPTAVGVQVVDQLPAGVTFVSAESSRPEMDYDPETGIWDVDYLDAGWVELRITATVDIGTAGTTITNFAQVTGDNLLNTEDDLASAEIFIPAADLSLSKRVDPPFPYVNVGDTIDYILQLNNSGPTAVGVQVVDQLPAGVTFVSAESSRPEMDYDPETGIWDVDYLDAGWVELRITATVDIGTAGTTITNFAQVTGDNLLNTEDDEASVEITVQEADTTAPTLILPSSVVLEATEPEGTIHDFEATAIDDVDASPVVSCDTSSGSIFPLGATVVICTATDASGNSSSGSFTVTVEDKTPPVLTVPADIAVEGNTTNGANVNLPSATATDIVDPSPVATCDADSGFFPLGSTVVTCTATDFSGNSSVATPATGPVAWWTAEGNADDIAGANHGALQNGVGFAAGKVGEAFSFDGIDDSIEVPDSPSLSPTSEITVSAWIDPDTILAYPNDSIFLSKWDQSLGKDLTCYLLGTRNCL